MNNSPLVSIVLPTYNGARYLDHSIQSCLKQSYKNLELIIVDDASIDSTPKVISAFAEMDSRISVIHHKTNIKLPGALNSGFAKAKGLYLTWTSDDNYYRPNAIVQMVDFLESMTEVDVVYTDYTVINEFGNPTRYVTVAPMEEIVNRNCIGACFLYRRKVYEKNGRYENRLYLAEDYDFWLRASTSFNLQPLRKDLYLYREHSSSLTAKHREIVYDTSIEALKKSLPKMKWVKNMSRADAYLRIAVKEQKHHHRISALKYSLRAIKSSIKIFIEPQKLGLLVNMWFGRSSYLVLSSLFMALKKMVGIKKYLKFRISHRRFLRKLKLKKFSVVLFSHELSNSGAPMALINVVKAISNHDGIAVVFSRTRGPIGSAFEKMHVPVIIDKNYEIFRRAAKHFDIAILNTVTNFDAVEIVSGKVPYVWWCHESLLFGNYVHLNQKIARIVMNVPELYAVSNYAKSFLEKYSRNVKILTYGIVDKFDTYQRNERNQEKIVFSMVGLINPVKGQDVFVDAILNLSPEIRKKATFTFIGKPTDQAFYQELISNTKNISEIIFTGELPREATLDYMSSSDVIVCSSRGDSAPIVLAEALMLGKLCIMSNETGTKDWIEHGKNGLIFDSNNSLQLQEMVENIILNPQIIKKFKMNARQTYLNNFSFDVFEKKIMEIIKEKLSDKF